MASRDIVALREALGEADVMYLTDAEAAEFTRLRMGVWFREGGLSEEEVNRAWELVAVYRERLANDVRTIGPTLTPSEVEHLSEADPNEFTADQWRRCMVAFELATQRGGAGVKPRNIARVLFPIAPRPVARWLLPRSQGRRRSPRRVRTRTSHGPTGREPDEPHDQVARRRAGRLGVPGEPR